MQIRGAAIAIIIMLPGSCFAHEWLDHQSGDPIDHHDEYLSLSEASALGIEVSVESDGDDRLVVGIELPSLISGLYAFDAGVSSGGACLTIGKQNWDRSYDPNGNSEGIGYTFTIQSECLNLSEVFLIYGHASNFHFFWINGREIGA